MSHLCVPPACTSGYLKTNKQTNPSDYPGVGKKASGANGCLLKLSQKPHKWASFEVSEESVSVRAGCITLFLWNWGVIQTHLKDCILCFCISFLPPFACVENVKAWPSFEEKKKIYSSRHTNFLKDRNSGSFLAFIKVVGRSANVNEAVKYYRNWDLLLLSSYL